MSWLGVPVESFGQLLCEDFSGLFRTSLAAAENGPYGARRRRRPPGLSCPLGFTSGATASFRLRMSTPILGLKR